MQPFQWRVLYSVNFISVKTMAVGSAWSAPQRADVGDLGWTVDLKVMVPDFHYVVFEQRLFLRKCFPSVAVISQQNLFNSHLFCGVDVQGQLVGFGCPHLSYEFWELNSGLQASRKFSLPTELSQWPQNTTDFLQGGVGGRQGLTM